MTQTQQELYKELSKFCDQSLAYILAKKWEPVS